MFCCCLRRNVGASCRKHFVVVSREKQTILVENGNFCLPPCIWPPPPVRWIPQRNIVIMFGTEKLEWGTGYPMVKKYRKYVSSFRQNARTWRTDRQADKRTDRQTPHDGIAALMHISNFCITVCTLWVFCSSPKCNLSEIFYQVWAWHMWGGRHNYNQTRSCLLNRYRYAKN